MTIQEGINQVEQGYQKITEANNLINGAITDAFLFTWQWWLGVGMFIIPWIVWFIFRRKESTDRLLYAGLISIIIGLVIDIFAISMGKWSYPIKIIPNSNVLFLPYHFSLLPVGIMLTLQIKPSMNPFVKGSIFAGLGAFVAMRLFAIMDFYNPKGWPSIYDFFTILSIYLVAHWFSSMNNFDKIKLNDKADYKYNFNLLRRKQKVQ